jgi:putative addiction module component (TIGR02574 family)
MSFHEVLAELPALSFEERQMLVRHALELDDSPLSPADETELDRRQAAHRFDPASALSLAEMKSRLRSRLGA